MFSKSGPSKFRIKNLKMSALYSWTPSNNSQFTLGPHLSPQLAFSQEVQGDCPTIHSAGLYVTMCSLRLPKPKITLQRDVTKSTSSLARNSTLQIINLGGRVSITSSNSPGKSCAETDRMKIDLSLIESSTCLV